MLVVEDILEFDYLLMLKVKLKAFWVFIRKTVAVLELSQNIEAASAWDVKRRQGKRNREVAGVEYISAAFWGWEI